MSLGRLDSCLRVFRAMNPKKIKRVKFTEKDYVSEGSLKFLLKEHWKHIESRLWMCFDVFCAIVGTSYFTWNAVDTYKLNHNPHASDDGGLDPRVKYLKKQELQLELAVQQKMEFTDLYLAALGYRDLKRLPGRGLKPGVFEDVLEKFENKLGEEATPEMMKYLREEGNTT